jgi:hypothetical protein
MARIEKTKHRCTIPGCGGTIVELFDRAYEQVTSSTPIGAPLRSWEVNKGYYCEKCGVKFEYYFFNPLPPEEKQSEEPFLRSPELTQDEISKIRGLYVKKKKKIGTAVGAKSRTKKK